MYKFGGLHQPLDSDSRFVSLIRGWGRETNAERDRKRQSFSRKTETERQREREREGTE